MTAYEHPETDKMLSRVFNLAMSNHTTLIMKKILDIYEGSWFQRVS
jgi:flavonol 3-O-methyltransferase/caffeic acid 3-O-methyltransferase